MSGLTTTSRILMSFIGILAFLEKTVPMGRLHMRSFQWYLKTHWKYCQLLDIQIPCSEILKSYLTLWKDPKNVLVGCVSTFGRPDSQCHVVSHAMSTAFDTIDHDTLLSCLSSRFGFAGSALKWFRSYLQDHFQSVKIGSSLSNLFKLKFGVPQGSVLGPLLFSLYTTPLGQVIRKYTGGRYRFYADDTQLFIHLSPDDSLKSFDRLKSCLNDIQVWMSENKLKLNPDKTEFIVFGAKDRHKWLSDSFPVNILGNCLSPADVVRNLDVLFDAKFFFTNHVNSVIKSCFISLRDLHRIRRFLSVDTSVVIANALVSSRLDYCNSLFHSLSSRNATRLQYVQNALARFVTGASKYTHITSTLRTLHWLPIRQRIIFKTLVLVYKYLTTGQPHHCILHHISPCTNLP